MDVEELNDEEELRNMDEATLLKVLLLKYRLVNGWHIGSDKDEAIYDFLIQQLIDLNVKEEK